MLNSAEPDILCCCCCYYYYYYYYYCHLFKCCKTS